MTPNSFQLTGRSRLCLSAFVSQCRENWKEAVDSLESEDYRDGYYDASSDF